MLLINKRYKPLICAIMWINLRNIEQRSQVQREYVVGFHLYEDLHKANLTDNFLGSEGEVDCKGGARELWG